MSGDTNTTNTGGGFNNEGTINAGGHVVNGDQINYYNSPPASPPEPTKTPEELAAMYSQASRAHLAGDLVHAEELYEQVEKSNPFYPGLKRLLRMVRFELKKSYVNVAGFVDSDAVITQGDFIGRDSMIILDDTPRWRKVLKFLGRVLLIALRILFIAFIIIVFIVAVYVLFRISYL
jgi:hypothetical protein